jgi:hypothetical protein
MSRRGEGTQSLLWPARTWMLEALMAQWHPTAALLMVRVIIEHLRKLRDDHGRVDIAPNEVE